MDRIVLTQASGLPLRDFVLWAVRRGGQTIVGLPNFTTAVVRESLTEVAAAMDAAKGEG